MLLGQHLAKSAPEPLRNLRCNCISYGVIPKAVDLISSEHARVKRESPVFWEPLNALDLIRKETTNTPVGVPNVVARPIRSGMTRGFGINAVGNALD